MPCWHIVISSCFALCQPPNIKFYASHTPMQAIIQSCPVQSGSESRFCWSPQCISSWGEKSIGMVRIRGMSAPSLPGESNNSLIPYKWLFLAFIKVVWKYALVIICGTSVKLLSLHVCTQPTYPFSYLLQIIERFPPGSRQVMREKIPLKQVVELAWKFVTLPSPIVVCQPDTFDDHIHNKLSAYWTPVQPPQPYKLIYVRPVVYRSYHGPLEQKGLVANLVESTIWCSNFFSKMTHLL